MSTLAFRKGSRMASKKATYATASDHESREGTALVGEPPAAVTVVAVDHDRAADVRACVPTENGFACSFSTT